MYAILYGILALTIYSIVILLGIYKASKISQHSVGVVLEVKNILEELKDILTEEEYSMEEKSNYKSVRSSGMLYIDEVDKPLHNSDFKKAPTLEHLITVQPTADNYETVIDLLVKLAKDTFNDYNFLLAKSSDETQQPHFLQLVSNWHENPEVHKDVFRKSVEYNLDMPTLQRKFAERVASGTVLDLGNVVVITDDGTGQPPTGVSPINSGLEGGEIAFIISFLNKDNYEAWHKNTFPEEEGADE